MIIIHSVQIQRILFVILLIIFVHSVLSVSAFPETIRTNIEISNNTQHYNTSKFNAPEIVNITYNYRQLQDSVEPVYLTVYGNNFYNSSSVTVLIDNRYECNPIIYIYNDTIICLIPINGVGSKLSINVIINKQSSSSIGEIFFNYPPPFIQSINPTIIDTNGNNDITMTGKGFGNNIDLVDVFIDDKICLLTSIIEDNTVLSCKTPEFSDEFIATVRIRAGNQYNNRSSNVLLYVEYASVNGYLKVSMYTLLSLVLILAIIICVLIMINSTHKLIKISSSVLCNVSTVASIIGLVSGFFLPYSSNNDNLTIIQNNIINFQICVWLNSLSFTLLLGPVVLKNYRLYLIFKSAATMKQVIIQNKQLYKYLTCLIVIDIILLCFISIIIHYYNINTNYYSLLKQYKSFITVLILITIYKSLLILIGLYIAIQLRHVDEPDYSERYSLGYCIYNISIASFLLLPVIISVKSIRELQFTLCIITIVIIYFGSAACLFIPKLLAILTYNNNNNKENTNVANINSRKYTFSNKRGSKFHTTTSKTRPTSLIIDSNNNSTIITNTTTDTNNLVTNTNANINTTRCNSHNTTNQFSFSVPNNNKLKRSSMNIGSMSIPMTTLFSVNENIQFNNNMDNENKIEQLDESKI